MSAKKYRQEDVARLFEKYDEHYEDAAVSTESSYEAARDASRLLLNLSLIAVIFAAGTLIWSNIEIATKNPPKTYVTTFSGVVTEVAPAYID